MDLHKLYQEMPSLTSSVYFTKPKIKEPSGAQYNIFNLPDLFSMVFYSSNSWGWGLFCGETFEGGHCLSPLSILGGILK